jgi:hypothetical protein
MGADELRTLGLRLRSGSPFISYVLVKKQTVGISEEQADRAIFVAGLPLGVDSDVLRDIFSCFGAVDQVALHQNKVRCCAGAAASAQPAGGGRPPAAQLHASPDRPLRPPLQTSGVVVFEEGSGAGALLKNAGQGQIVEYRLPEPEGSTGLKGALRAAACCPAASCSCSCSC